jgi:OFA family oxalate/formate antiporter-like MFS transporter
MLYALYCAAGIGAAFVYSGSIGSALKWFKDRRGLASGIMAAGFGGGTALFIPFISWMIANRGYQAAFLSTGLFQGLVIVIVAQVLRHPHTATTAQAVTRRGTDVAQLTTLEVLRRPQFYMMYAAFLMMGTGFLLATANLSPIAKSWGLSATAVTLAATFSPLANGASRIFWGWASDKTGRENAMVVAFLLNAVCLLAVLKLGQWSGNWFAFGLVLVYFTGGQIYSLFPAYNRRLLRNQERHVELCGALHRKRCRSVHWRVGRAATVRAVRQLGRGILRQRRARGDRGPSGVWSASIADRTA